jgi:SAM-dependent methyltransferase
MPIIPFYGVDRNDLFAIERQSMDASGRVIDALSRRLPDTGLVLDIGAGSGFTARRLASPTRRLLALEPARKMIRARQTVLWMQGDAEHLPLADGSVDAAYATWAYFFSRGFDPTPGLAELHRVVRVDGPLLIVENLGDDELTSLAEHDITADVQFWESHGFGLETIETSFEFADLDQAHRLLRFYFGERGAASAELSLSFNVGLFSSVSRGSG